jgi:putative intracellular protease/amidase
MKKTFLLFCMLLSLSSTHAADVFVEAESFGSKGGWKTDQEFMDVMGSPYLLAHGMGTPVADACQKVQFPQKGTYHVYVRTFNWTSPWWQGKGPGQFKLLIDSKTLPAIAGCVGNKWMWQYLGTVKIKALHANVTLKDLTGFDGRCDAIYFNTNKVAPPSEQLALERFRREKTGLDHATPRQFRFDFVVAGGGVAGICAAVAAAREGLKVALVNDRPVVGGNNSSEIRVNLGGRINLEPYPNLGNLIKEFGPSKGGNAMPAQYYEDDRKMQFVMSEPNITLFANTRITSARTTGNTITSITGQNIETGQETIFEAPLFSDCTGDGTLGVMAGAEYMMGREDKSTFGETRAPDKADKMTLGASVEWYSVEDAQPCAFPDFNYGVNFNEENKLKTFKGDWNWETGMNKDQIAEAEQIRDYGLLVVYSNWSFLKNHSKEKAEFARRRLQWVCFLDGKRESRRLKGDYILNGRDLVDYKLYPDATACTSWTIDLHEPEAKNSKCFPGSEFISTAIHTRIYPYPVPYRCLYSHNIANLFMAGRDISVSHVALGTVRVMRTGGMLGEVVGLAASLCNKHHALPRDIYTTYLDQLQQLMKKGAGKQGLSNNQNYGQGGGLTTKPK